MEVAAPAVLAWRTMSLFGSPKRMLAWAFVPNRSLSAVVGVTAALRVCPTSGPGPDAAGVKDSQVAGRGAAVDFLDREVIAGGVGRDRAPGARSSRWKSRRRRRSVPRADADGSTWRRRPAFGPRGGRRRSCYGRRKWRCFPPATPWPPLRSASGVSGESAGVSAAPCTGWDIAPKAWSPVTLVAKSWFTSTYDWGGSAAARVDDVSRRVHGKGRRGRVRAAEQLLAVELRVAQRDHLLDGLIDLLDDGLALRSGGRRAHGAQGGGLDRSQEIRNAGEGRIGLTQVALAGADVRLQLVLRSSRLWMPITCRAAWGFWLGNWNW